MSEAPPIIFVWDGEAMAPAPGRFAVLADREFVVGERYRLIAHEERSMASHGHYFAQLHDRWQSLPEHMAERFPSVDHLRRWALIKAGYCDSRQVVCATKAEAQRVAAFIRPMDAYGIVTVTEAVVTHYTAKSQSMKAQGRKEFQASKQAVLDIVDDLLGIGSAEREKAA